MQAEESQGLAFPEKQGGVDFRLVLDAPGQFDDFLTGFRVTGFFDRDLAHCQDDDGILGMVPVQGSQVLSKIYANPFW